MKLIDFHTHIYPDKIARKGSQSICDFYGLNYRNEGSTSVLLEEGKLAGISEFVLLPVAIKPEHVRSINEFTAGEAKKHKEFYGFGTVHAEMNNILHELDVIEKLGLWGVKIHPDTQQFDIDDDRLFPMYDALQGRMPILIHCGDPRYEYSRPEKLKKVLHLFPNLTVIGAHLGGWAMFDKAFEYLKDEKCYFDMSSCMMFLGLDETQKYIKSYGADRVLFGTDFPTWDPVRETERFLSLDLTDEEREKIAHLNAESILKI